MDSAIAYLPQVASSSPRGGTLNFMKCYIGEPGRTHRSTANWWVAESDRVVLLVKRENVIVRA